MRTTRFVIANLLTAISLLGLLHFCLTPKTLSAKSAEDGVGTLHLSASQSTVNAGEPVTFTVLFTNTSGITLENFTLVDHLPVELQSASVQYDTLGALDVQTSAGYNVFTLTAQSLAVDGMITFTIPGLVPTDFSNQGTLVNSASLTAIQQATAVSNSGSVSVTVNNPNSGGDLSISKQVASPIVDAGSSVGYTIVVSNVGTTPATSVVITDVAPAGMFWSSGQLSYRRGVSPTMLIKGDRVTVTFASLSTSGVVTVLVNGTVRSTVAHDTVLTNIAGAQAEEEQNLSNNFASANVTVNNPTPTPTLTPTPGPSPTAAPSATVEPTIPATATSGSTPTADSTPTATSTPTVTPIPPTATATVPPSPTPTSTPTRPADLAISKTANVAVANPGDSVIYTVLISNVGDVDVAELNVVNTLQPGIEYVTGQGYTMGATGSQLFITKDTATFSATSLLKGGWISITLEALVGPDVAIGSTLTGNAQLSASNDSDPTNNQSTYQIGVGFVPDNNSHRIYLPVVTK